MLLWFFKCNSNHDQPKGTKVTITTKAKTGSFPASAPAATPITTSVIKSVNTGATSVVKPVKTEANSVLSKNDSINLALLSENVELKLKFVNYKNDSLKLAAYKKAIELKDFSKTFDNPDVKIDVSGKSRGEVIDVKADYKIKEQKQDVYINTYRVLGGAEVANTKELSLFRYKANLFYLNSKGDLYNVSFGDNQYIGVGFAKTLWSKSKQNDD